MTLQWSCNRGDTIAIPYLILEGFDEIASVSAELKVAINPDQPVVSPDQPVIAEMTLVPIAPDTGWYVGLPAAQCRNIAPDIYVTQVRQIMTDGTVAHSEPLLIHINESVSEAF